MSKSHGNNSQALQGNKLQHSLYKEWLICSAILCAIAFTASFWSQPLSLQKINNILYDSGMRLWPATPSNEDIVIIGIDDNSVTELGYWPWPRSVHAQLLSKLKDADIVIFDILFSEHMPHSNTTQAKHTQDQGFARAIAKHGRVLLPEAMDNTGKYLLKPISILANSAKEIGRIDVQLDDDGVLRSVDLWRNYQNPSTKNTEKRPHISLLASQLQDNNAYKFGSNNKTRFKIAFNGPPRHYQIYSYADVLGNRVDTNSFKNKKVIIGAWATGIGDKFSTPISSEQMSGAEVLANLIQNIHNNHWIYQPKPLFTALFNLFPVLIICLAIRRSSIRLNLLQPLVAIIIFLVLDIIGMHLLGYWIPPAGIMLALAITYPLWSWRSQEVSLRYIDKQLLELHVDSKEANNGKPDTLPTRVSRLMNAVTLMDQSIKERNETLSFLSHDMRAPQSAILSSLDLRELNPDKYTEQKTTALIKTQASTTLSLIEQFLNLNQARYNQLQLEQIPLALLLDNCINDVALIADKHGLNIENNLNAASDEYIVNIDYSLMARAVRNLLFNAIHYSTPQTTISINVLDLPGFYAFSIKNHGPIISKDEIPLLFQSFRRGKDGTNMDKAGMGLGLALVAVAIQRHKGKISCSSSTKDGTVFTIELPKL